MLQGPDPRYVITIAAPKSEMFLIKKKCWISLVIGSGKIQNLWKEKVLKVRNSTKSQAPVLALYPSSTLTPPKRQHSPKKGINIVAMGIPFVIACLIADSVK